MLAEANPLHVDDVSRTVGRWLQGVAGDAEPRFVAELPGELRPAEGGSARVLVCFRSIRTEKPDRAAVGRDEVFLLTYWLRVTGADVLATQRTFSEIWFAARAHEAFDARQATHLGGDLPATLELTARLVRPAAIERGRIVEHPLAVRLRPIGRIRGQVLTRGGIPVMGARITSAAPARHVVADEDGRFSLAAPRSGTIALEVAARQRSIEVLVEPDRGSELVIVMPEERHHG